MLLKIFLLGLSLLLTESKTEIMTWEVYEVILQAEREYENPYELIEGDPGNDLLTVHFRGTEGNAAGKEIDVAGFWYEGQTWKVRFSPPASGTWEYKTFSEDTGLSGKTGTIHVSEWDEESKLEIPTRHGLVQVSEEFPNYFFYSDGTPFLWIGDTWWNWTKRSIHFSSFQNLVDDRAEKGFTVGQLFVAGNGWGREASILDETYTVLDTDLMQKVDQMIEYANSKGMTIWVHGWWSRENIVETIGEENMRRWWRYLIHRLGAYNVIWTIAGEYNLYNYGGFDLLFWKELGQMIKDEDPYERIVGAHPTPPLWGGGADAPQWSTGEVLHEEPWLDYNQSQPGHGRWRQEMTPKIMAADRNRKPAKPTLVTEPWYEFVEGNPSGKEVRFGAWSSILSGAAGHTYGGGHVWLAHLPESPAGGGPWPLEESFDVNTLDYEGARSMSYMVSFFEEVEWWKMHPAPELIHDYREPYCLANEGEEYVVYLRWGGPATIDLSAADDEVQFVYRWFNPATGEYHSEGEVSGGDIRIISPVEDYPGRTEFRDWVLHIKKTGRM
ncbi:MAG: DUF4038 domain-containing protein [Balneolaceae bacterium]|nr:MAG: DUF4038 domain-containing protein [Balneolaceae bacterium]